MAKIRTNNYITGQLRQGDVLVELVKEAVREIVRKELHARGLVLAEGESTGHAHLIDPTTAYEFEGATTSSPNKIDRFIRVLEQTQLEHNGIDEPGDHEAIALLPGVYRVIQQLEFSPMGLPVPVRD